MFKEQTIRVTFRLLSKYYSYSPNSQFIISELADIADLIFLDGLFIVVSECSFDEVRDGFDAPLAHADVRMLRHFQQVVADWPPENFDPVQIHHT